MALVGPDGRVSEHVDTAATMPLTQLLAGSIGMNQRAESKGPNQEGRVNEDERDRPARQLGCPKAGMARAGQG